MPALKGGANKVGAAVGAKVGTTVGTVGEYIKEQRLHAQYSLRQLAEAADVSNPYLSQIERGLKKPSAEILQQIAKALRLSAETLYVRAGILEDRGDAIAVPAAIFADPALTERQKRALVDIYTSFRTENGHGSAKKAAPAKGSRAKRAPRSGAAAKGAASSARRTKTARPQGTAARGSSSKTTG